MAIARFNQLNTELTVEYPLDGLVSIDGALSQVLGLDQTTPISTSMSSPIHVSTTSTSIIHSCVEEGVKLLERHV